MTHKSHTIDDAGAHDPLVDTLNALGEDARKAPDSGFESRLLANAMAGASSSNVPTTPLVLTFDQPRMASHWRLAATIAISAASLTGITWVASWNPAPSGSASEVAALDSDEIASELEEFFSSSGGWDLGFEASIVAVRDDLESVSTDDTAFWGDDGLSDLLYGEDAL